MTGPPGFGLLTAPLRAAAAGARMTVTATAVVAGTAGSAARFCGNTVVNDLEFLDDLGR